MDTPRRHRERRRYGQHRRAVRTESSIHLGKAQVKADGETQGETRSVRDDEAITGRDAARLGTVSTSPGHRYQRGGPFDRWPRCPPLAAKTTLVL